MFVDRLSRAATVVKRKSAVVVVVATYGTHRGRKGNGSSSAPRRIDQPTTLAPARLVISRNVLEDLSLLRVTLIAIVSILDPTALKASGESLYLFRHFGPTR